MIKAIGMGGKNHIYSLSALKFRILLRKLFDSEGDNVATYTKMIKRIYEQIKKKGWNEYFQFVNEQRREMHYKEAGINRRSFFQKLNKYLTDEYDGMSVVDFATKLLLPKKDYISYAVEIFGDEKISILDAVIYRLFKESPIERYLVSDDVVDFQPSDVIFIYTNIIAPEHVDNSRLRVLDIMSLRAKRDNHAHQIEFSNTHYKRVDVDILTEIEFLITTSLGTPVPFQYGPATIQLHFRRIRSR